MTCISILYNWSFNFRFSADTSNIEINFEHEKDAEFVGLIVKTYLVFVFISQSLFESVVQKLTIANYRFKMIGIKLNY